MDRSLEKSSNLAYIYGGLAILLWSTVATAFKIALKDLNVTSLLFIASWVSFFILLVIVFVQDKQKLFFSRRKISLAGALNPFLYYLALFRAYDLLPAQEAQPISYTWPIALTVLSAIFLGDKIPVKRYFGICLSFFGIVIISTKGFNELGFTGGYGVVFALLASIIWASYWILNKKSHEDELIKMCTNFFVGSLCITAYALITKTLGFGSAKAIFAGVYVGLFEMGITFLFWAKGLKLIDRNDKLVRLSYLSPFISLIFIGLILGEKIMSSTIIGLLFIILGLFF